MSFCFAAAVVGPVTLGPFTVCEAGCGAGGFPFPPKTSNQPLVESGPMTFVRMLYVPRKTRIAATRIKSQGMRLRRRTGSLRVVSASLEGATRGRRGRGGATAVGTAVG